MPSIVAALAHNLTVSIWIEALHIAMSVAIMWLFRKMILAFRSSENKISQSVDNRILRVIDAPLAAIRSDNANIRADIAKHNEEDAAIHAGDALKFAAAEERDKRIEGKVDGIELKVNELLSRTA